jgi:chromosome segregation ATPase
MRVC